MSGDPFCPMHSDDWLAKAVRQNRVLSGMQPQPCVSPAACLATAPHPHAEANEESAT